MILVNFKTYSEGTGEKAVKLVEICEKVAEETEVEIIPVVQVVDSWRARQEVDIPIFVQHVDLFEPGKHTGWVSLEGVIEAGAAGTLLNHSEHGIPPGMIKQILKRVSGKSGKSGKSGISKERFRVVVCAKTLGQAQRLVKLKPDFLAYEPPELIGAKQVSVATAHPKTIEKVVKLGRAKGVPVIVGAGIHSPHDVKIILRKGAVGILVATDVVLAKEPEKELTELAEPFRSNSKY